MVGAFGYSTTDALVHCAVSGDETHTPEPGDSQLTPGRTTSTHYPLPVTVFMWPGLPRFSLLIRFFFVSCTGTAFVSQEPLRHLGSKYMANGEKTDSRVILLAGFFLFWLPFG